MNHFISLARKSLVTVSAYSANNDKNQVKTNSFKDKNMRAKNIVASMTVAAVAFVVSAPLAHAESTDNLADLVATDGSLTVGDKTFSGFSYVDPGLTDFNASQITVTASSLDGVDYLTWAGNFTYLSATPGSADLLLNYTVTASAGLITEIDQQYTGGVGLGVGAISIAETVSAGNLGQVASSYLTTGDTSTPNMILGSGEPYIVPGQSQLEVTKDINLAVIDGPGQVTVSQIEQSFHQSVVPDGGWTVALLGSALTAMGLIRTKVGNRK
jgi:hypothetical protein